LSEATKIEQVMKHLDACTSRNFWSLRICDNPRIFYTI